MSLSRRLANLGKAIDSATTGHFLSKGDSDGLFETIQYTDLTGRPTVLDSANITAIVDSAYIQLRQTTGGSGGLDSAAITNLVDSAYVSARSPAAASGFASYEYNTSAAQTTFQDSDVNGNILSYSENGIIVYYNGVLMPTSDYTATDGSSVVFTTAVDSGGTVTIAKWALASSGGSGGAAVWYGDRGIFFCGNFQTEIDYININTPGNASDFGSGPGGTNRTYSAGFSDGTYGVFGGGKDNSSGSTVTNAIDYITIATTGNSSSFGDLTTGRDFQPGGAGDGTYGIIAGGYNSGHLNSIDYVTVATPANASNFGNLTNSKYASPGVSDGTYGVFGGGIASGPTWLNVIDYITIASTGNATDFGDLTVARYGLAAAADTTRGVFAAGAASGDTATNTMDYITITSTGNATDFGDITTSGQYGSGLANDTYGVFSLGANLGTTMEYITIQTTGNSTDFGDRTYAQTDGYGSGACSGSPS